MAVTVETTHVIESDDLMYDAVEVGVDSDGDFFVGITSTDNSRVFFGKETAAVVAEKLAELAK